MDQPLYLLSGGGGVPVNARPGKPTTSRVTNIDLKSTIRGVHPKEHEKKQYNGLLDCNIITRNPQKDLFQSPRSKRMVRGTAGQNMCDNSLVQHVIKHSRIVTGADKNDDPRLSLKHGTHINEDRINSHMTVLEALSKDYVDTSANLFAGLPAMSLRGFPNPNFKNTRRPNSSRTARVPAEAFLKPSPSEPANPGLESSFRRVNEAIPSNASNLYTAPLIDRAFQAPLPDSNTVGGLTLRVLAAEKAEGSSNSEQVVERDLEPDGGESNGDELGEEGEVETPRRQIGRRGLVPVPPTSSLLLSTSSSSSTNASKTISSISSQSSGSALSSLSPPPLMSIKRHNNHAGSGVSPSVSFSIPPTPIWSHNNGMGTGLSGSAPDTPPTTLHPRHLVGVVDVNVDQQQYMQTCRKALMSLAVSQSTLGNPTLFPPVKGKRPPHDPLGIFITGVLAGDGNPIANPLETAGSAAGALDERAIFRRRAEIEFQKKQNHGLGFFARSGGSVQSVPVHVPANVLHDWSNAKKWDMEEDERGRQNRLYNRDVAEMAASNPNYVPFPGGSNPYQSGPKVSWAFASAGLHDSPPSSPTSALKNSTTPYKKPTVPVPPKYEHQNYHTEWRDRVFEARLRRQHDSHPPAELTLHLSKMGRTLDLRHLRPVPTGRTQVRLAVEALKLNAEMKKFNLTTMDGVHSVYRSRLESIHTVAAQRIQAAWRGYALRMCMRDVDATMTFAATSIQRAWRHYWNFTKPMRRLKFWLEKCQVAIIRIQRAYRESVRRHKAHKAAALLRIAGLCGSFNANQIDMTISSAKMIQTAARRYLARSGNLRALFVGGRMVSNSVVEWHQRVVKYRNALPWRKFYFKPLLESYLAVSNEADFQRFITRIVSEVGKMYKSVTVIDGDKQYTVETNGKNQSAVTTVDAGEQRADFVGRTLAVGLWSSSGFSDWDNGCFHRPEAERFWRISPRRALFEEYLNLVVGLLNKPLSPQTLRDSIELTYPSANTPKPKFLIQPGFMRAHAYGPVKLEKKIHPPTDNSIRRPPPPPNDSALPPSQRKITWGDGHAPSSISGSPLTRLLSPLPAA